VSLKRVLYDFSFKSYFTRKEVCIMMTASAKKPRRETKRVNLLTMTPEELKMIFDEMEDREGWFEQAMERDERHTLGNAMDLLKRLAGRQKRPLPPPPTNEMHDAFQGYMGYNHYQVAGDGDVYFVAHKRDMREFSTNKDDSPTVAKARRLEFGIKPYPNE